MTADSICDRIIGLLLAEKRDFEARQPALTVHPITGKPIRKDDLIDPYPAGTTDRQLNSGKGYYPGPSVPGLYALRKGEYRFWKLVTCGVQAKVVRCVGPPLFPADANMNWKPG